MRREPYFWLTLVAIGFMGILALGELWEQDIFWQIRAGSEFLTSWSLPHTESWSYTSAGEPWNNFQWLATLGIAAMHQLYGIPGLIVLRMLLALAVLGTLTATLARRLKRDDKWPAISVTIALVAVAISPRTQIRPDFMMLLPYALLGLVWATPSAVRRPWILSLLLLLVATNLHPGTALFAIGFSMLLAWEPLQKGRWRLLFFASCAGAWCFNPYLTEMPAYLSRHIFYASSTVFNNPDHAPLLWSDFGNTDMGLYAPAFLLCALLAIFQLLRRMSRHWSLACLSQEGVALVTVCLLIGMTINRQRTMPFAAIAMAPYVADALLALWHRRTAALRHATYAASVLIIIGHSMLGDHILGLRLNYYLYPMECIRFMQQHEPLGQVLHVNRWGDIILGLLPKYKVLADSREMPFDKLGPLFVNMYNQPQLMAEFIQRYDINTIMLPLDFFQLAMHEGDLPWSRRLTFFPPTAWAVVAHDNLGILLLKRIPQHAALIEAYEYHLAIPDVPPEFYVRDPGRSPQSDERFSREVARCLKDMPSADYCALLEARWLRREGSPHGQKLAQAFIAQRLAAEPKNVSLRNELKLIESLSAAPSH